LGFRGSLEVGANGGDQGQGERYLLSSMKGYGIVQGVDFEEVEGLGRLH